MVSKELQTKYIQLQMMKQQMATFAEQKQLVDEKSSELIIALDTLNKLRDIKKGTEIWNPVGGSVFVASGIMDVDKVLVGIGAGIVLKKLRTAAIDILQLRLNELTELDKNIITEIRNFSQQAERLETEVQQLAEKES